MLLALFGCLSSDPPKKSSTPSTQSKVEVDSTILNIQQKALSSQKGMEMLISLCDDIGPRLAGSPAFDLAVEWGKSTMQEIGLEEIHTQAVRVNYWQRGTESLSLIKPRRENIHMLGLGMSIATPKQGIQAPAVVVSSFDELEEIDVRGKIVIYNVPFTNYGETVS